MKLQKTLAVLVIALAGTGCHRGPAKCESYLIRDFTALTYPDGAYTNGPDRIQKIRQAIRNDLSGCTVTGMGESNFYPFPLTRLDFAAAAGDADEVGRIVTGHNQSDGYYTARSDLRESPLHFAAANGTPAVIETLLNSGFDVNVRGKFGDTPLMAAVATIDWDTNNLDTLIRHGADINARNKYGMTALMMAVIDKNAAVVQDLLNHGASLDTFDSKSTLLDLAREAGDKDVIRLIQAAAANRH